MWYNLDNRGEMKREVNQMERPNEKNLSPEAKEYIE